MNKSRFKAVGILLFLLFASAVHTESLPGVITVRVRFDHPQQTVPSGMEFFRIRRAQLHLRARMARSYWAKSAALSQPPAYVRVHNLFTSGDGSGSLKWGSTNVYTEDAAGNPVYDWKIVDRIFDTFQRGRSQAVGGTRVHAGGAFDPSGTLSPQLSKRIDLHRLGLSAEGLPEMGRTGVSIRPPFAPALWRRRREDLAVGSLERSRTSATGKARTKSFSNSTTIPPTQSCARSPARKSAARMQPAFRSGPRSS